MKVRWVAVLSLLVSACGAASDVGSSAAPEPLDLVDPPSATVSVETTDGVDADQETTSTSDGSDSSTTEVEADETTSTTEAQAIETTAPSTTVAVTAAPRDPNAEFCQAAMTIDELGTSVSLDDTEVAAAFFDAVADGWSAAVPVAPASIVADIGIVATFRADLRDLLAANEYDLFAVFEEATELEVTAGADLALIRSNQFIYANCEIEPPNPEQATAAFYGELLGTAEDRTYLAELLASAEIFTLDGAVCFVGQASADVMHPLVGAPSTPAQDAALSGALSVCQLSIGL